MLKFEALANVGDTIKAFDHKPFPGRAHQFVVGVVTAKGRCAGGYDAFTIDVIEDSHGPRVGHQVFVPFQVSINEYDTRVQLIVERDRPLREMETAVQVHTTLGGGGQVWETIAAFNVDAAARAYLEVVEHAHRTNRYRVVTLKP